MKELLTILACLHCPAAALLKPGQAAMDAHLLLFLYSCLRFHSFTESFTSSTRSIHPFTV